MKRLLIPLIFLFSLISGVVLNLKEQACFWLDEDGEASICYEKNKFLNNDRNAKKAFANLVNEIQNPEDLLDFLVTYSDELERGLGGREKILREIRDAFSWIKEDSLVYIVEGNLYSVVLLDKGNNDKYALFLDTRDSKFFFSYDIEKHYQPIDIGWINGGYPGGIHINLFNPWRSQDNAKCLFKKANVSLYTSRSIDTENGNYICEFGEYQFIKTMSESVIKLTNIEESQKNERKLEQVDNPTMRFINWISN